jgi:hypothetical protein
MVWQVEELDSSPKRAGNSRSALVKGRGFVLVFSPVQGEVMAGLAACAVFLGLVWAARRVPQTG